MTIAEDARAILDAAVDRKVAAVDTFAAARAQREQAAATLRDAEMAETEAWAELKRLDWSDTELRSLGLNAPGEAGRKRTTTRTRHRRAVAAEEPERS